MIAPLLERIAQAHGGRRLWDRLESVEAVISARGALFALKHRPILVRARMTAFAHEPRLLLHDYLAAGQTGELVGPEEVRILGPDGGVRERRTRPRAALLGPGKFFSWDALDFLYFCGYATWGYLLTPFLLLFDGVRCEQLEMPRALPRTWLHLRAHFPPSLPVHSRTQEFYFDEQLRLRRLDYVAEVVGAWAHAAHFCEEYRDFDGLPAPTRRRVHPIIPGGLVWRGPTLVAIDVHALRPVAGEP